MEWSGDARQVLNIIGKTRYWAIVLLTLCVLLGKPAGMADENKSDNYPMTTAEVADWYRVTEQTLRKWRSKGQGPQWHVLGDGKRAGVRYMKADIDSFLRWAGGQK